MKADKLIINLNEVGINDIHIAGGKNASLGEMITNLSRLGVKVPGGFVITVKAYQEFINYNKLDHRIREMVNRANLDIIDDLRNCGAAVRKLILDAQIPPLLIQQIDEAYSQLALVYTQDNVDVAVRSSATAEDLPDASFAGQQESFLNISGVDELLTAVKGCFASLFTDRAISYRESFGYDHFQIGLSVCVQKMVRSDLAASGVAFSIDTESGFKDAVIINGSYGLGEMIVQGAVSPDEYCVFKPALKKGYQAIIEKKLGDKNRKMVYSKVQGERVSVIEVTEADKYRFCLTNAQALQLASWVVVIEDYYSSIKGKWCPMDVEWAMDGLSNELYIVQARPETIYSRKKTGIINTYEIADNNRDKCLIMKGIAVGDKIGAGHVNILGGGADAEARFSGFKKGDVLVTEMTDPDWEPIMKIASAIITDKGGRTCHAAIVARELGIPAIVGCGNATELLKNGQAVTASCAEGEVGLVYNGLIPFIQRELNINDLPTVRTPVMMNVASPEKAFQYAGFPSAGVGLAREEFIINNYIGIHPMALLKHQELNDAELSNKINNITRAYKSGEDFFVEKLSYGIAKIAAAFWPNKVIVRFSDFKSNEYYNLLGGKHFEPIEENPMIGWRGASRYFAPE